MASDGAEVAAVVFAYFATYLLHSTLLLGTAWLIIRRLRSPGHAFSESLWKFAAVGGLVTTPLVHLLGLSGPFLSLSLGRGPSPVEPRLASSSTGRDGRDAAVALGSAIARRHALSTDRLPRRQEPPTVVPPSKNDFASLEETSLVPADNRRVRLPRQPGASDTTTDDEVTIAPTTTPPPIGALTAFTPSPSGIGLVVALVGFGGLLRLLWQSWAFRARLARCRRIGRGPTCAILEDLLGRLPGRRRVVLFASTGDPEPVAFGFWRWHIVLPWGIEKKLAPDELRALLAHELAHLVRGDSRWLWFGRLLCTFGAVQPLNFLARRRWRQAAEFQCDDWAVEHAVPPLALARCLTRVAEWKLRYRHCAVSLAAVGAKSTLTERVERLVRERRAEEPRTAPWNRRTLGLAALCAILLLSFWGPRTALDIRAEGLSSSVGETTSEAERTAEPAANKTPRIGESVRPGETVPHRAERRLAPNVGRELRTLDRELERMELEVHELSRLVEAAKLGREAQRLLARTRSRANDLRRRRAELVDLAAEEVDFKRGNTRTATGAKSRSPSIHRG